MLADTSTFSCPRLQEVRLYLSSRQLQTKGLINFDTYLGIIRLHVNTIALTAYSRLPKVLTLHN